MSVEQGEKRTMRAPVWFSFQFEMHFKKKKKQWHEASRTYYRTFTFATTEQGSLLIIVGINAAFISSIVGIL